MSSLNRIQIIGRVGKDPEIRTTGGGMKVATFSVATSEKWTDKQSGEKKERTQWHNITCFSEGLCKTIENYVKKGDMIFVEGAMEYRTWEKQDGSKGYAADVMLRGFDAKIVLLGGKGGGGGGGRDYDREYQEGGGDRRGGGSGSRQSSNQSNPDPFDDSIPF